MIWYVCQTKWDVCQTIWYAYQTKRDMYQVNWHVYQTEKNPYQTDWYGYQIKRDAYQMDWYVCQTKRDAYQMKRAAAFWGQKARIPPKARPNFGKAERIRGGKPADRAALLRHQPEETAAVGWRKRKLVVQVG